MQWNLDLEYHYRAWNHECAYYFCDQRYDILPVEEILHRVKCVFIMQQTYVTMAGYSTVYNVYSFYSKCV